MKFILAVSLCICSLSVFGQTAYTNDASLLQTKKNTSVVRATGIHANKKEATQMALKSAFDTYFFSGIAGLNEGKPLLAEEAQTESSVYLERFFDDKNRRYLTFVASYAEDKNPEKLPNKTYRAHVQFEIYTDALQKDLEKNKVPTTLKKEIPVEEIQEIVAQPTIMVVPYKQGGYSYKEVLTGGKTLDYRTAINEVQAALIKHNYEIRDFMAALEATEKSMLMESNETVESFDAQLINNSGADVYVVVDAGHNVTAEGIRGSIGLTAYERSNGNLLASKQAVTTRYKKGLYADVYRIAIAQIIEPLLQDITAGYAKKMTKGNTLVVRVATGSESGIDLNEKVGAQSLPLSDALRTWMRKNALNGRFHVQGSTRDLIIFDQVQAQSKSQEGYFLDANDFALELYTHIHNELNVACDKRVDGSTIYITITE